MDHHLLLTNPCEDGCEFFSMAAPPEQHQVVSQYLPHIDLLERFFDTFKEQAASTIKEAEDQRIYIPNKYTESYQSLRSTAFDRETFLDALNFKNPFSSRESQCAKLLIKGYTHKMIAKALNISPRTVDAHIEHMKKKTNLYTRSNLLEYIERNLC